jgi:hypothetical protein
VICRQNAAGRNRPSVLIPIIFLICASHNPATRGLDRPKADFVSTSKLETL